MAEVTPAVRLAMAASVSATPQPQPPGSRFAGSFGQRWTAASTAPMSQTGAPSPSFGRVPALVGGGTAGDRAAIDDGAAVGRQVGQRRAAVVGERAELRIDVVLIAGRGERT